MHQSFCESRRAVNLFSYAAVRHYLNIDLLLTIQIMTNGIKALIYGGSVLG
jgi:hypothetical protein